MQLSEISEKNKPFFWQIGNDVLSLHGKSGDTQTQSIAGYTINPKCSNETQIRI